MTYVMDHDELLALWQNARWFAGVRLRWKKIGEDRYRVTTNYPWRQV